MKVKVEWTGAYPCLCCGTWIFRFDNGIIIYDNIVESKLKNHEKFNDFIELLTSHMNTFKEYNRWYFNEDYLDEWEKYTDGLKFEEWKESDKCKLLLELFELFGIDRNEIDLEDLYEQINKEDFRPGTCGGCI